MSLNLGAAIGYLELDSSRWVSSYNTARQQMQTLADSSQSMSSRFQAAGQMLTSAGSTLTTHVTLPIAAIGTASIKTAADFESSMSNVQALSGATGSELEQLSDLAKEMGANTQFSASEAADALGYMALAGWDTQQSMEALPGVLNLAAASGMDLADASDMVTDYLSAFGEEADQAGRMADVLAYAQAHSNTTTAGLGEAFKNCAANANAFGLDIEQTTALIGKLSDQGLKGSEAGTALSAVFRDITQKMDKGNIVIGKTKVAVQDANGNYRAMTDILKDVENATNGMGDAEKNAALMNTFTSDSLKALNILLQTGSGNISDFEAALRESSGSAEEMAEVMNDNLNGQITALKSALEGAAISIGEALLPMIKGLVSVLQEALNWFNGLSDGMKTTIVTVGLIVAAIGPLLLILGSIAGAIGNLLPVFSALGSGIHFVVTSLIHFRSTMQFLRLVMVENLIPAISSVATSLGSILMSAFSTIAGIVTGTVIPALSSLWAFMLANPITLIITAIVGLVAAFIYCWNNLDGFKEFFINAWENIKKFVGDTIENIKAKLSEWGQSLVNFITTTIPNFINSIGEWFGQLPQKISYVIGVILGLWLKWHVDSINFIVTNVPKWISMIIEFFSELPGKLWTWFVASTQKTVQWGYDMGAKAKEAGSDFINKVIQFIQQLPSKVWNYLTQTIQKAANFATNFVNKGKQAANDFKDKIVTGVKSIPSKMVSIGKDIVKGIWSGITGMGSWLKSQISSFASGVISGFKSSFKINSPSKIMRDIIGRGIVEGIGVGIDQEEDNLLTKANSLASSVVDTMSDNITTTNLFNTAKSLADSMAIANQTNSTQENNANRFESLLHIENLTINDDKDIETLANDLAFYLKRKNILPT